MNKKGISILFRKTTSLDKKFVGKPATWKCCLQHLLRDSSNRDEETCVVYRLTGVGVVYWLTCNDCDQTYIGETGSTVSTRTKEHASYVRIGRFNMSAVADNAIIHQHSLSFKNVQIVEDEPRAARGRVKAPLQIRTEKNQMNKDKGLELDRSVLQLVLFEFSAIEIGFAQISRTHNHQLSYSGFPLLLFFCASPGFLLLSHARYAPLDT